jgi:hypothetical protein
MFNITSFLPGQINKSEWKLKTSLGMKGKKDKRRRKKEINEYY